MDLLEIAAATGMPEGTVKVHLHRAVRAVRSRMANEPRRRPERQTPPIEPASTLDS
jgi:DNA-directed RNA polymerase specialized sigma24 family protein